MKVKNYLWTLAAALALVGCSDDLETQKGGPEENGNGGDRSSSSAPARRRFSPSPDTVRP